jgi:hypothetical protein
MDRKRERDNLMAHFAELDNNVVVQVIVVHNNELLDENNQESEQKGIDFCVNLFGGNWIQTSYNNNFRGRFCGRGWTYDPVTDAFFPPKPYPSWTFNEEAYMWESPIPIPSLKSVWDESLGNWVLP